MISPKLSLICCLNVISLKENHMIDKHKQFQLFFFNTLSIALILSVHFACHRVCTGVNKLLVVHISMGTFVQTQKRVLQWNQFKLENSNIL